MNNILVTGGIGFVGANLVRYLAEHFPDANVVAADISAPDTSVQMFLAPVADRCAAVRMDVAEREVVRSIVETHTITHIVHAAAITPSAQRERKHPTEIVDVNLGGAINVLDAAITVQSVQRVLLISSSGVYGAPAKPVVGTQSEAGPLDLTGLYAITKRSVELLGARYNDLHDVDIASVRLAAPYGVMERPTGSRENMGHPRRLLDALLASRSVRVAGPTVHRNWTYVADTAQGISGLLGAPAWSYDVYNVSSGQSVAFRQLVNAFVEYGLHAEWIDDVDQADVAMYPDQERAPLDVSRLRTDTDFTPRFSIKTGIEAYVTAERTMGLH